MNKILSFDAETNGLWGTSFAIGAVVYEEETCRQATGVSHFIARCPIDGEIDPWVYENVLPVISGIEETHTSYDSMLSAFSLFYMRHKKNADVITHIPVPVESGLIRDMHEKEFIGDWDAPFPLIDIAPILMLCGENPLSVDDYAKKHGLSLEFPETKKHGLSSEFPETHNPLYDAIIAAKAYVHLKNSRIR